MSKYLKFSLLTTILIFGQTVMLEVYADTSAINIDQALSKLENRFFEHQYSTDDDSDRIDRLEKFVFGCTQSGSTVGRVQHLVSTLPDETLTKIANSPANSNDTSSYAATNAQLPSTTSSGTSENYPDTSNDTDQASNTPAGRAFDYSSYPSVTTLEQQIFNHTYTNDTLPQRLNRLETKAFGAPSKSNDLSQRVDNLESYEQRHDIYGENKMANNTSHTFAFAPVSHPVQNMNNSESSDNEQDDVPSKPREYISKTGSFVGSVEERVSMMEAQSFGHTYPDRPLDKRLSKLEKKLLPNQNNAQLGLFERTGKLWAALHPADKNKVDQFLANNELVDNRIVSKDSANTTNNLLASSSNNASSALSTASTNNNTATTAPTKKHSWLSKLAASMGNTNNSGYSIGSTGPGSTPIYNAPGMYNYTGGPTPAGYTSRSFGASFGPGAGPFGVPIGFW